VAGAGQKNFGIGGTILGTTGGNDLLITATTNLHHFWDAITVTGAMRLEKIKGKSIEDFAKAIVEHPPADFKMSGEPDTWPVKWATESLTLASDALTEPEFEDATRKPGERGDTCTAPITIDQDYRRSASATAFKQLSKAGFRLSELLVAIFEGH
jgi:hypothetical protein